MVVISSSAVKGERRRERWEEDRWGKEREERKEEMVVEEEIGAVHRSRKYDRMWACRAVSDAKGTPLASWSRVRDVD